MDEVNQGVEEQEVAEPVETPEAGAEVQEVAEPVEKEGVSGEESERTAQDAAFAELRRAKEDAEKKNEELQAQLEQRNARRQIFENVYGNEEPEIEAIAERLGLDVDELREEIAAEEEIEQIKAENARLASELEEQRIVETMKNDLAAIQKIDPSVKSLEQLGEDFLNFVSSGLSGVDAYFAIKAKETATRAKPPAEIGKVNRAEAPKDFYSEAEVDAMSEEEVRKNLDVIHESMKKWK